MSLLKDVEGLIIVYVSSIVRFSTSSHIFGWSMWHSFQGLKVPGDAAGMPNPYVEVECLGEKRTTQARGARVMRINGLLES